MEGTAEISEDAEKTKRVNHGGDHEGRYVMIAPHRFWQLTQYVEKENRLTAKSAKDANLEY
jgi:hypothetical protein